MPKINKFWVVIMALIILSAYVVPYTFLSGVHAWYGSFLWWGLVALATIIVNIIITKDWGKEK